MKHFGPWSGLSPGSGVFVVWPRQLAGRFPSPPICQPSPWLGLLMVVSNRSRGVASNCFANIGRNFNNMWANYFSARLGELRGRLKRAAGLVMARRLHPFGRASLPVLAVSNFAQIVAHLVCYELTMASAIEAAYSFITTVPSIIVLATTAMLVFRRP
jgi:hypothetical protein